MAAADVNAELRMTAEDRAARDRQRARTRYALEHPRPLVIDRELADDLAFLDAADLPGRPVFDWSTIPDAKADDRRGDELQVPAPRPRSHGGGSMRRARYLAALLEGAFDDVARAEAGNRNNVLARAAFQYGRVVGAGLLDEDRARAALEEAAQICGLPHREAVSTIGAGLRAGARHPLETK